MNKYYVAPGAPGQWRNSEVEKKTTVALFNARDKVLSDHKSFGGKLKGKFKKQSFFWMRENPIAAKVVSTAAVTGAAVAATIASGGAALVGIGIATGAKLSMAIFNKGIRYNERKKKVNNFFGPEAIPAEADIAEFITSVVRHFKLAQASYIKTREILESENSKPSDLAEHYTHFRHHLDKAAFYLQALLSLSIEYYKLLGSNESSLAPSGKQQRDLLFFLIRAGLAKKPSQKDNSTLSSEQDTGLPEEDSDYAYCPEDHFEPFDLLSDASELELQLKKMHEGYNKFDPPDPRDSDTIMALGFTKDSAKKLAEKFKKLILAADSRKLNNSMMRPLQEQDKTGQVSIAIEFAGKTAGIFIPFPGVSFALTQGSKKLWGKVAKTANLFGKGGDFLGIVLDEKEQIKSASIITMEKLSIGAVKVNEYIMSAARHIKVAEQKLDLVKGYTVGYGDNLDFATHIESEETSKDKEVKLEECYMKLAYGHRDSGESDTTLANIPKAITEPDNAAKEYYEYVYHMCKAITYTRYCTLFECSLSTGISELYEWNSQNFLQVMKRLNVDNWEKADD